MGIIVCQKCNEIIAYVEDEKVTVLYALTEDHQCEREHGSEEESL